MLQAMSNQNIKKQEEYEMNYYNSNKSRPVQDLGKSGEYKKMDSKSNTGTHYTTTQNQRYVRNPLLEDKFKKDTYIDQRKYQ